MSIDLAINNVGEYFSAHYLADNNGFAKDIRDKTAKWKEQGSQSAPRLLQGLSDNYFKAKARALDYPEPEMRSSADEPAINRWHPQLLQALGYQPEPFNLELPSEKQQLPVLLRLHRHSQPWLVIAQAPFCVTNGDWVEEPLEEMVEPSGETRDKTIDELPTCITEWEQAIGLLFRQEDRPRWLMLMAGSRIYLFDAHSYSQGRYLYIDLDEAYARRDTASFNAIAALLSKETLAPTTESEDVLHEKLREGSLKSTHGVSEQLQGAVREAIELIANGWVESRRASSQGYRQLGEREEPLPDGSRQVTAEQLKHDALVYVYRILFCLYGEARGGELGILPISDEVYRLGYSLEALRDLADRGQPGTLSESGSYYAEHLATLFKLVHQGFHPEAERAKGKAKTQEGIEETSVGYQVDQGDMFGNVQSQLFTDDKKEGSKKLRTGTSKAFIIQPLTATLFDPAATPLLDRIKLSNRILQQVIRRLSLGTGSNNKQIGRINYAELGIVQLGSVYEGLLSYKGFFAEEDLIQVCKKPKKPKGKPQPVVKDNAIDPKEPTWFVPRTREEEFKEGEIIVEHRTGQPRIYKAGEFILHLNGVDRVNSASYYTPEVLTRALVKEALKERLKDFGPDQADEILKLKICEPAMGSAAFLVEAIDQLGRHYLELKQEQVGNTIDPSEFEAELRRVRHYIAVHNVYGVDLNPVAVELGALSLWLASIHSLKVQEGENGSPDIYQPGQTPWFGLRLRAGNSLIGARRAVWTPGQLAAGKHYGKDAEAPRQLKPCEQRKPDEIYHFLVWDEDMAPAARDKLMRQYWPDECDAIKQWQSDQVKKNWNPEELAKGRDICAQIDVLWEDYAQHRIEGLARTECTATVWPTRSGDITALKAGPSLAFQESLKENLESQSGAFQRLKLLMDSWCSFYFWPLENSDDLPSRKAWLASAEVLLGCETVGKSETRAMLDITLGDEIDLEGLFAESQEQLPDATKLAAAVPWYEVARAADQGQNFHHWELIFTEVLGPLFKGQKIRPEGFDLIFGNPPWAKVSWNDSAFLAESDPLLGVRSSKLEGYAKQRNIYLGDSVNRLSYRDEFLMSSGSAEFLNDNSLFPELEGFQTNLYKNFIVAAWRIISEDGISGLLHPEGVYEEASGFYFRSQSYVRLRAHYQFQNSLGLFSDVKPNRKFSINLYGREFNSPDFVNIANLFHPDTIEKIINTADGPVPGLKDELGKYNLSGHVNRRLYIKEEELIVISGLVESDPDLWFSTRLPSIHSIDALLTLKKLSSCESSVDTYSERLKVTPSTFFHETHAQGVSLERNLDPVFKPVDVEKMIFVMGHIGVGCALSKIPLSGSGAQVKYEAIDLSSIGKNYIPQSIYSPLGDSVNELSPSFNDVKIIKYYRYANRVRSQPDDTRTLISAVIPKDSSHVNSILSVSFDNPEDLLCFAGSTHSVIYDFFAKSIGKENWGFDAVGKMPLITKGPCRGLIINRALLLNCVTDSYEDLWNEVGVKPDDWAASGDPVFKFIDKNWKFPVGRMWAPQFCLKNDILRRQALLELDVLVAIHFDISVDELVTVYKNHFPTFSKYERLDVYDSEGKLLPNFHRGMPGREEIRQALSDSEEDSPISVSWSLNNGLEEVTKTFYPPFNHVDRIEDYKTAYRVFSERLGLDNKEIADAG